MYLSKVSVKFVRMLNGISRVKFVEGVACLFQGVRARRSSNCDVAFERLRC